MSIPALRRFLSVQLARIFAPAPVADPLPDAEYRHLPPPGAYLRDLFDDPVAAFHEPLPPPAHPPCTVSGASGQHFRAGWR